MHFDVLVEDQSGKKALDILLPKIIGDAHSFIVTAYKGLGKIPKDMKDSRDAGKRILLDNLPKLLKGYGRTYSDYKNYQSAVIVVCDLDDKCLKEFLAELKNILNSCNPKPETRFCIAIEEMEAWLLGDIDAIRTAFPQAKLTILQSYVNDSICGTWEKLADAIYKGGVAKLSDKDWQTVGKEKSNWAEAITPHMKITNNQSPSFIYFCRKMRELADI